jgi:hypothetical protein
VGKLLNVLLLASIATYLGFLCWGLIEKVPKVDCRNAIFLSTEVENLLLSIFFIVIGLKIDSNARDQLERRMTVATSDARLVSSELSKKSVEFVKQAEAAVNNQLSRMWIIISVLSFTNFYVYLYSQILFYYTFYQDHPTC